MLNEPIDYLQTCDECEKCERCGSEDVYKKIVLKGEEFKKNHLKKEEMIFQQFDGKRFGEKIFRAKVNYFVLICKNCQNVTVKEFEL